MAKKKENKDIKGILIFAAIVLILYAWSNIFEFEINVRPSNEFLAMIGRYNPTPTPLPEPTAESLTQTVIPDEGYTVDIVWGDIGKKLIETGAIDMGKYKENYSSDNYRQLISYLTDTKDKGITIDRKNAYFWVNTLWALGLTQRSDVLINGIMGTNYEDRLGNFASTGGWTLGAKDAVSLYASSEIVPLTEDQQKLVDKVSQGIYRPCCGNPTSFPDCNHGMAILGLLEIMASQGKSEEEMYKAALAFNSYWFSQTYMDLAYYFQKEEGITWDKVDPKKALSAEFSSAQGYQAIKKQVGNIPGLPSSGGSCGA